MDPKTFAMTLAKDAGAIISTNFAHGMEKEWKGDGTPLTVTDTTIDALLRERVHNTFPNHGIISEEGEELNHGSELVWVCDPLDGTVPFSHGIPTAVFSLALVQNGEPILGVVYDPFMDRMFVGEKGKGARMNDEPIRVSSKKTIEQGVFGIVLWSGGKWDLLPLATGILQQKGFVLNVLSGTHMGMLVGNGELCAAAHPSGTPWDTAPLKVIVEEAGGRVTDLFGEEQRYDQDTRGALISNGILHDELIRMTGL
ncbi:MAG: inositol monophosphatase [Candidatus Kerfeldbacteria bacterium]|nr:inositol monophosphatase [Candidatus Kerfeldbacteria bacterium]